MQELLTCSIITILDIGGQFMEKYQDINSRVIDSWVDDGWVWGQCIDHETYIKATKGDWDVVLTPTKPMPHDWFPMSLKGQKILGLASGGGQQMPIFAALGADCTVLDYSSKQLESELRVSQREGYEIKMICFDMTKPLPFADNSFDIIFHPVSNDYVETVDNIFKECYRILKKGGILICGLSNGINFISNDEITIENVFPFNPLKNPDQMKYCMDNNDGVEFSHTLEEQIGGQLKAGFILTDLYEDTNGEGHLHDLNIPTFMATRAIK